MHGVGFWWEVKLSGNFLKLENEMQAGETSCAIENTGCRVNQVIFGNVVQLANQWI